MQMSSYSLTGDHSALFHYPAVNAYLHMTMRVNISLSRQDRPVPRGCRYFAFRILCLTLTPCVQEGYESGN